MLDMDEKTSGAEQKNSESTSKTKPPDLSSSLTNSAEGTSSWRRGGKFLVLVLIVVVATILVVFYIISNGINNMLLSEKTIEKQLELNLIREQIDLSIRKYDDWESSYDHYVDTIVTSVELLDRVDMTYAAVFDEDLRNVSVRSPSYEGSPFEPGVFPEYVAAVHSNESGNIVLPFTPPGSEERDMHLRYQWIPSNPELPHRVLAVVAISRFTINTRVATWVQITAVLLAAVSLLAAILLWRRKMAESLNRTLENTVKQRTAELEEQTVSAKKASLAKSDFLSNMSHEMRTPMNAIIGMTAIAKNSDELSRKDYCLKKIEDASTHLLSVINDILDMSKIEANKFELSFEKFNFERVLQKVANIIVFRIDERNQDFTVHIDKDIPAHLIGDDQRITQVITNLMSNAVKFTPEGGGIQLNAYLVEMAENICTIKVEVIDTGIGISEEQQKRLFSSFVQAENSTTRKFGGTGLGLAISKHIVEIMGGEIWLKSELGKGSTFSFTIQAERVVETTNGQQQIGLTWGNMRVLVVDDALDTREYFADIMQRFGSSCDVAASGEEACALIKRNGPYNLYFIDWRMDEMNGVELAQRIRALDSDQTLIVMSSVSEWDEIQGAAKSLGITKFLPKPLFPSNIADCINECLGSGSMVGSGNELNYKGLFKGYRILLAEDVEVNREIVVTLLEPTELTVDTAENGVAAVELFSKNPDAYDMIFMDVQMPEMDGYEATRKIRNLDCQWAKEIPIVAMTANVFREDIEKCLACGMNDHLGKPLNYEKMMSILCGHLFMGSLENAAE